MNRINEITAVCSCGVHSKEFGCTASRFMSEHFRETQHDEYTVTIEYEDDVGSYTVQTTHDLGGGDAGTSDGALYY